MCLTQLLDDCNEIIQNCKSLNLATNNDTSSHCSYAPFIWTQGKVYILVSALAQHTGNLKVVDKNSIGCMLIEDEAVSAQIYARRRLMFKAKVFQIDRESDQWYELIGIFKHRFGEIIDLLDSLPDFSIFELNPETAVLVKGFGDAQNINEDVLVKLGQ